MLTKLLRLSPLFVCAAVSIYVLSLGPVDDAPAEDEVLIHVWYPWGGDAGEHLKRAITAFNTSGVRDKASGKLIRAVPVFAADDQKLFLAVAGGMPPDVTFVDGPEVCEWAHRGALAEMEDYIADAGIRQDDFYPPCWRQNVYRGHIYALTFCADPNFGFFWNKESFRRAGLDPDTPPRTIAELDDFAEKLTIRTGNYYDAIGIIPWNVYGAANSMYTWGWVFGGTFYDYEAGQVTCDDERIVKALEWMISYDQRFDKNRVGALMSGFGSGEQNPLVVGKIAMAPTVIAGLREIRRYAPGLDMGIAAMPYPDSEKWGKGEKNSSWVGGWCLAIPNGARHPDAAFAFIRWICATDEGTDYVVEATGSFPGYRKSRYIRWLSSEEGARTDPARRSLLRILEECKHQRPVIPAQAFYMHQLERAFSAALYKGVPPRDALEEAREATQRELDRLMAKTKEAE